MVKLYFGDDVDETVVSGGGFLEPGTYLAEIADPDYIIKDGVETGIKFRLTVLEGDDEGKTAAFDNLWFSEGGAPRTKFALLAFGFTKEAIAEIDLEPEMLRGRRVTVTTAEELSCNSGNCFGNAKIHSKDGEGGVIWQCVGAKKLDACEWRGATPKRRVKPTYAGYELVEGEAAAGATTSAAGETVDAKEIPF